ncbi:response regulator [bacterium]|nr:response regulator [bacterium]
MKILIVDDLEVNLELLEARLEGNGYEVTIARNGIEALEILKTDSFDMIISDILMPKMDGYQLCRECKKDDTLRKIPFVFYTATYTDKKDEEFALSLGVDRFIVKPMESKRFVEIIEGVLKNHKKGLLTSSEIPVEEEDIYLKEYNERLINKLEKKMLDLEREIFERKQTERALLSERNNLRNIFESIEDGIYTVNQQYDIQYVNPVLVKDFGHYEGVKCYRYFHDLDKVCPWCKNQDVLTGKTVRWEWYSFKNERTYDLIGTPMTLPDGTIGKLEIFRDITERKKSEVLLTESQETLLAVLDSINATIYVADMETCEILFMNKHMKESFGADFTGKICWEEFRHEHGPCVHCTNDKLLDEEGNPTGVQVRHDQNTVTGKWYINYDQAIKWIDGRYVRLQVATDITDLKKMEDQLRQAQKMEAIGILAGGVAHDFNNILTIIIGNASLALMEVGKDGPLREEIEEIKTAGERAASLTRQLLAFSRKQIIQPKILDLNELLTNIEKMLGRLIGEDVEILMIPGPELWQVEADPWQMEQVIINLVVNAKDAMPKGGVSKKVTC